MRHYNVYLDGKCVGTSQDREIAVRIAERTEACNPSTCKIGIVLEDRPMLEAKEND